ncbi:MAG: M1 family metallopeptidase, partial [Bacteroidota bacterium]
RNYSLDILHYKFELTLSDGTDEIIGKTSIVVLFNTDNSKQLRFDLIKRSSELKDKGMWVESVFFENSPVSYKHEKNALYINLPRFFAKNTTATFVINYRGIPADGLRIGNTKHGERSFFNENWPNRTRHWLPTVDHPYDKATNEFVIIAPSHYQVISNGLLVEESILNANQKLTHWKQSVPISSWLYVLGVARFAVQYVDEFMGKQIQTWVYPQDREKGFFDFASPTKEVLGFYSNYVGPFAYEKLANIQSPSVGGGMETASAIFYGENLVNGKQDTRLRNVVIHEIAHQWFGNAVTESTWDDAWLSEGFATYFTMLFQEYAYGTNVYIDELKKARARIFNFYSKDSTYKIIDNRTAEEGPVTNDMTYQKGAWVLHMLREKMGHEAFREGIRSYYQAFYNKNATTDDFFEHMQKFTKATLNGFRNQWLHRPEVLNLQVSWHYDSASSQLEITIDQKQSTKFYFEAPIEIEIIETSSKKIVSVDIIGKTSTFKIKADKKPVALLVDPRTTLLAKAEIREL